MDATVTAAGELADTLTPAEAASRDWDALVVGAGPAGALAARLLAREGLSVLLVDRSRFPRAKPCGGCFNRSSVAALQAAGLGELLEQEGALPLRAVHLHSGARHARLPLPGGWSLSRGRFDAALLRAAAEAGAAVLTGVRATRDELRADARLVRLDSDAGGATQRVAARVVLVAGGLGASWLEGPTVRRAAPSRIGAGAVLEQAGLHLPAGELHMACDARGYVGLVRAEQGRLVVGAALDPSALIAAGGPGAAAAAIVRRSGLAPIDGLAEAGWLGTPPLTRQASLLAAPRAFVLGDAAGFVEPFTGEGLAWALSAAHAVQPLAREAARAWRNALAAEWTAAWTASVARRQRLCRRLAFVLRHPLAVRAAVRTLALRPQLGAPLLARLGALQ